MMSKCKLLFNGATDTTGYGSVGVSFLQQLLRSGVPENNIQVKTDFARIDNSHGEDWNYKLKQMCLNKIGQPDLFYNLWNPMSSTIYDIEIPQILETVFETDYIQQNWVEACNMYDVTWLPSKFCVDTFKRSGVVNTMYMPYGFDFSDDKSTLKALDNDKRFKFLFINQWSNRKYARETVEAFCKTFTTNDNVVLYIRTFVLGGLGLTPLHITRDIKDIKTKYPDSPQIVLLDHMKDSTIHKLYNSVNCLLSPSRGEGVGRTIVEAMSHALPVITTNWSAMTEYANSNTAYMLDYELVRVQVPDAEAKLYYFDDKRMHWAEPNFEQLCDTIKLVYENYDDAKARGVNASNFVRDYYSWDKCLPARLNCMEMMLDDEYNFGCFN